MTKINFETIIDFDMGNQTRTKDIRIDFVLPKPILGCPNRHPNMPCVCACIRYKSNIIVPKRL